MGILLSIKPEYVEKILNGDKTIEIRKSMPRCELPIKVYLYCTKGQELWGDGTGNTWYGIAEDEDMERIFELTPTLARLNCKVVAEFTLNKVDCLKSVRYKLYGTHYQYNEVSDEILTKSCFTQEQVLNYTNGNDLYAWHIDNLIIYDKPKELSDFKKENKCHYANYEEGCCFEHCTFFDLKDCDGKYSKITVAPQNYMFVEDIKEIGEEI